MRSIQDLAREAECVQNACNLSGVVRSFAIALEDLRPLVAHHEIATHPIMIAWVDKIASLVGVQNLGSDVALDAHRRVTDLARVTG